MEIPAKIKIPLFIEQGCVYNFHIDFSDSKKELKNRYFVVLNSCPKTDLVLIMITPTTQIKKKYEFIQKAGISQDTLVRINPKEYSVLKEESVFNCNNYIEIDIEELIKKIEEDGSMNYPKMPKELISKLINGMKKSPRIPEEIKKLL